MLIEFTVGNFRSFKEPVTLSMAAAKFKARDPKVNINNTFQASEKLTLLTSAAVYGANASGKSNLVRALAFMRQFIIGSSKDTQAGDPIPVDIYRLSNQTENQPAFFQIIFLVDGIQYRYGFEVTQERVVSEWLFSVPSTKEARLFIRDENGIKPTAKFKEGIGLEEKTRPNALFLSVAAQWNGLIAMKILQWFQHVGLVSGLDDTGYRNFTVSHFADGSLRQGILDLVKTLDLGISDIYHDNVDRSQLSLPRGTPEEFKNLGERTAAQKITFIKTIHTKWDAQKPTGNTIFDMGDESEGTQKLFFLAGPVLDSLHQGNILAIDEMEARLHPILTHAIIGMFNSVESNPKRAQLIFTTHDTNLLSNKFFRRDQIWFIEKDVQGSSRLYSLAELKVRNDASFESDYIEGRYGAIPYIGDIRQLDMGEA